jgi:predicted phage terminase large subunit-like protein
MAGPEWAEHAARAFEPTARRFATPGDLARALEPSTVQTPALELIDAALVDVEEGRCDRLIICMSPQEGKSTRVTMMGPLFMLTRNPDRRIAVVSYGQDLANQFGRAIRNHIASNAGEDGTLDLGLRIAPDNGSASSWQIDGHKGGVRAVGLSGGLTGRPADCLRGDTLIETESGYNSIRDIHRATNKPRVLSFNHELGRCEWARVVASRSIAQRELVEIVSVTGRRIVCTPDHRIATEAGYKPAEELAPGDRLIAVHSVRADIPDAGLRARQEGPSRANADVLFAGMHGRQSAEAGEALQGLRHADRIERSAAVLLLARVQGDDASTEEAEGLPAVRRRLSLFERAARLLHKGMRGRRAFEAHGGLGQFSPQGRDQLRTVVPGYASADIRARSERVPGLRRSSQDRRRAAAPSFQYASAPLGRESTEQRSTESHSAVRNVSRRAPQVTGDAVSVVRRLRGERDTVYDLQVEGNSNFFAGEILVHNCLFIDDPISNMEQAQSSTYRDRAWNFWQSVGSTRLAPGAPVVLVLTRWHEEDLAGRLLAAEDGRRWRVVSIPAIAERADDPLGREPGTPMVSARGDRDWAAIRATSGEYVWNALYQQRPAPAEGGLFKRASIKHWQRVDTPTMGRPAILIDGQEIYTESLFRFLTVDLAASTRTSADFTAVGVWGISPDGNLILLDGIKVRVDPSGHWDHVRRLRDLWAAGTVYVEAASFGTTMVYEAAREGVPVSELKPDKDKFTRALPAAARAEAGRLYFPSAVDAPWVLDWIDELAAFPHAAHDDVVDIVAYAARVAIAHWLPPEPADITEPRRMAAYSTDDIPDLMNAIF